MSFKFRYSFCSLSKLEADFFKTGYREKHQPVVYVVTIGWLARSRFSHSNSKIVSGVR